MLEPNFWGGDWHSTPGQEGRKCEGRRLAQRLDRKTESARGGVLLQIYYFKDPSRTLPPSKMIARNKWNTKEN